MRLITNSIILLSILSSIGNVAAEFEAGSINGALARGESTFQRFCSVCHGKDGKGEARYDRNHESTPSDLTQISHHNNGKFPWLKLYNVINKQEAVSAHEASDMPNWGNQFDLRNWGNEDDDKFSEEVVYGRIFALLVYINSIQDASETMGEEQSQ